MLISHYKTEAIAVVAEYDRTVNELPRLWKFSGLNEDFRYVVIERTSCKSGKKSIGFSSSGKALMSYGLDFGYLKEFFPKDNFGGLSTKMFYVQKEED